MIEGATHGIRPCAACEKTPGQYGNSVRNYFDYVAKWINARFYQHRRLRLTAASRAPRIRPSLAKHARRATADKPRAPRAHLGPPTLFADAGIRGEKLASAGRPNRSNTRRSDAARVGCYSPDRRWISGVGRATQPPRHVCWAICLHFRRGRLRRVFAANACIGAARRLRTSDLTHPPSLADYRRELRRTSLASVPKVDGHALALREAVEHSFERVLAADAALFEAAVGLSRKLTEALVDLNPP